MKDLVDATRGTTVVITEHDRVAVQCSPRFCVIANAIARRRDVEDQRVGASTVRIKRNGMWHRYDIDQTTASLIRAYDEDGQVMPAGVRIKLVPPRRPLNSRAGTKPGSGKRSGAGTSVATRRPSTRHVASKKDEGERTDKDAARKNIKPPKPKPFNDDDQRHTPKPKNP